MATGAIALERLQAGLEAVRGTPVAATRRVYGQRGQAWWEPTVNKEYLDESMSSYIDNYRHVVTGVSGKLSIPFFVTPSDLAWWGQLFWKGAVPGVNSATTVYTYTFPPTVGADDLKTGTFEASSDVQGYQFPFGLGEKLEISWQRGQTVRGNAEVLVQQGIPQAVTAAIGDRTGLNAMAASAGKVYIDNAGGAIGTTQVANVLGGKITWENHWEPIDHIDGQLFYDDAVRATRSIALELDIHYKDNVELAHLTDDAERLIRVGFTGPIIAGSVGNILEGVNFDFYGHYTSAPFGVSSAIRTVKLGGVSQYDAPAGFDWRVAAITSVAVLP